MRTVILVATAHAIAATAVINAFAPMSAFVAHMCLCGLIMWFTWYIIVGAYLARLRKDMQ